MRKRREPWYWECDVVPNDAVDVVVDDVVGIVINDARSNKTIHGENRSLFSQSDA